MTSDHDRLLEEAMLREANVVGEHVDDGVLLSYRAQRVDEETERKIDEHLGTCPDCRALLSAMAEPVSEKQRAWAQSEMIRRRSWIGIAVGIVAIAAAVLFAILQPPPRDLTEYQLDGPHGMVKSDRAGAETDRVTPDSRLSLRLLPPEPSDEPIFAAIYADEGRSLRRAAAEIEVRRGVFAIEATGRELFGDTFGRRRLVVLLATREAKLEAKLDEPDLAQGGLRQWWFELTYEPGSAR